MKEAPAIFYETKAHRVVTLLRAGLQVRHRRELEPKFHEPPGPGEARPMVRPTFRRKERTATASGFVYVFAAGAHVKIGISDTNVDQRWNSIRGSNPLLEPPLYVTAPLGDLARKVERAAHKFLSPHHENGEWFRCAREIAIETVKRLEKECING